MSEEWQRLYEVALGVENPHKVSESIDVGSVGAAILSAKGNIYTGVCVDTSCSLGICAERNAMTSMFTAGEYEISMVCSIYKDGTVMPPCGACREFMMQLGTDASKIQVLLNKDGRNTTLKELMPEYPY